MGEITGPQARVLQKKAAPPPRRTVPLAFLGLVRRDRQREERVGDSRSTTVGCFPACNPRVHGENSRRVDAAPKLLTFQ